MKKKRLVVLISGSGTNLQAIIDGTKEGVIPGEVVLVIANRKDAFGLKRAQRAGIDTLFLDPKESQSKVEYDQKIMAAISACRGEFIILAGYLRILTPFLVKAYEGRIINIHPSLIPQYCGQGFYGLRVHEAVLAHKEKETGVTVHFVDEGTDTGAIILQEKVAVLPEDTPQSLQERVLQKEHEVLIRALQKVL